MPDRKSDFTVDLAARRVSHSSGAAATFREYQNEEDWLRTDAVTLHNPSLYDGPEVDLARLAKEAAINAGMKRSKP